MINSSELLSAGRANISEGEISVGLCNVEASVLINFVTCFVHDKFSNRNSAQASQVIWDPPKKISRNICQIRKETEIITIFVFAWPSKWTWHECPLEKRSSGLCGSFLEVWRPERPHQDQPGTPTTQRLANCHPAKPGLIARPMLSSAETIYTLVNTRSIWRTSETYQGRI